MHTHKCPTCSRKTKTCLVERCPLAPFVCGSCAGAPPTLVQKVGAKLGLGRAKAVSPQPTVDEHVDDPEWEGSEPWRHPLDPLAHKRVKKPKPVRFWHPIEGWVIDQTGTLHARNDDRPIQEPENFERPGAPPWWRRP